MMPTSTTSTQAARATDARGDDQPAPCTNGDNDENHFDAFKHHRLEGSQARDPVWHGPGPALFVLEGRLLVGEGEFFVVQRNEPSRPEYGLAQPPQAEQAEAHADPELQQVMGNFIIGIRVSQPHHEYRKAAKWPAAAGRQPRSVPTASTIVKASTTSTRDAKRRADGRSGNVQAAKVKRGFSFRLGVVFTTTYLSRCRLYDICQA